MHRKKEISAMKLSLPTLLSVNGGYVDTSGFLALHGLFTAHVTGNFVTLGAAMVQGTSGAVTKLSALPVFCLVVVLSRLLSYTLQSRALPVLRTLIALKLLLLALGAWLAIRFGPFPDGDAWAAFATGMVLVAAMAIQNAAHRIHLASDPPSTLMTGTTTQIMIDLADLLHDVPAEMKAAARARLGKMSVSVAAFALGCAAAALFYKLDETWCFIVPPLLACATLALSGAGQGRAEGK
jgi:uncharacterized membrane protein YoaK (UPF0700 family)